MSYCIYIILLSAAPFQVSIGIIIIKWRFIFFPSVQLTLIGYTIEIQWHFFSFLAWYLPSEVTTCEVHDVITKMLVFSNDVIMYHFSKQIEMLSCIAIYFDFNIISEVNGTNYRTVSSGVQLEVFRKRRGRALTLSDPWLLLWWHSVLTFIKTTNLQINRLLYLVWNYLLYFGHLKYDYLQQKYQCCF